MRNVFIIFRAFHLSKNFTQLRGLERSHVRNPLFLELNQDLIVNIGGNFGTFLGLKLGEPFIKMINFLIGIITNFARGILVGWLITVDQNEFLVTAFCACKIGLI